MKGLIIHCEMPYFATFRKPASTSLILTFPVPPFTTIRGMLANALGLQQHDHSLQDQVKLSLRVLKAGFKNVEMAKILKLKEMPRSFGTNYPSSPMFKEFLVNPQYDFFVAGEDDIMQEIHAALLAPQRPLYLGQSDDLVVHETSELMEIEKKQVTEFDSAVEGIHAGCMVEKVPYVFGEVNGRYSVDYKLISVPRTGERVNFKGIGYGFGELNVFLF